MAPKKGEHAIVEVCGHELRVSSPSKVFFPERGLTKLDLVNYYVECEQAVVRHLRERPTVMKRWVDGVEGEPFFQKRVPDSAPEWLQTATVTFPSGRHARELVPNDAAHLVWGVNLGVIDWNPWPVRRSDLDHPDELRVDLDPGPEVPVQRGARRWRWACARCSRSMALRGFPKTSGSRGMHIYVRIVPEHGFPRSAPRSARAGPRGRAANARTGRRAAGGRRSARACSSTTTRTRATARSPRPTRSARWPTRASPVRCDWEEVADVDPAELRLETVPARLRERGDPSAGIDEHPARLESLLELAARDEREGLGDAPWPPHFRKQKGEPPRRPAEPGRGDEPSPLAAAEAAAGALAQGAADRRGVLIRGQARRLPLPGVRGRRGGLPAVAQRASRSDATSRSSTLPRGRYVLDGEIVVRGADGREDFDALGQRIHPAASRVERLSVRDPRLLRGLRPARPRRRVAARAPVRRAPRGARGAARRRRSSRARPSS